MKEMMTAIYSTLSGDGTLSGLATIHNSPKLDQALPYIDISDVYARDWSTKSYKGDEFLLRIHVWTAESLANYTITDRIEVLLHDTTIAVTGQNFVFPYHDDTRSFPDIDSDAIHGIASFMIKTHS